MSANSNTYIVGDYSSSGVTEVIAGNNITISGTIALPIINATGGGSGGLTDISAGIGIKMNNQNPKVVSADLQAGAGINISFGNPTTISASLADFRPSYTIYVANNGNDATGTGGKMAPFQTIGRALTARNAITDTVEVNIYIEAGNYNENLTIATSRTYLTTDITSEARESCNITGNINIAIPTISTIGVEHVVGLSNLQINGNIVSDVSCSGAYVLSMFECNLNQGNLTLNRRTTSGSTCVIENCRFNPTGDISTIISNGFINQFIGSQILTSATTQPTIVLANAPVLNSPSTIVLEYSYIQNNSIASTVGPLMRFTNSSNSSNNRIGWSRLSYASSTLDTGTGNKCCVQFQNTGTVSFDYVNHNIFECDGATVGGGQPHIMQKLGTGSVTLLYEGGNLSGTLANKYDTNIIKTSLVPSS